MIAETLLRGSPAGRPSDTRGQQPEVLLVLNPRDERAIAWLIEQAGLNAVQQVCGKIFDSWKLYPSNLARVRGLSTSNPSSSRPPRRHVIGSVNCSPSYLLFNNER